MFFLTTKLIIKTALQALVSAINHSSQGKLIQGHYDKITNKMVRDTVKVYLRDENFPYPVMDSSKAVLDSNGNGLFNFFHVLNGQYYIVIKHRNSIETWSKVPITFTFYQLNYDFTN